MTPIKQTNQKIRSKRLPASVLLKPCIVRFEAYEFWILSVDGFPSLSGFTLLIPIKKRVLAS